MTGYEWPRMTTSDHARHDMDWPQSTDDPDYINFKE